MSDARYTIKRPPLARPTDSRVTAAFLAQHPELAGLKPFDPDSDVDVVDEVNRVSSNLLALIAYADPELSAAVTQKLVEIAQQQAALVATTAAANTAVQNASLSIARTAYAGARVIALGDSNTAGGVTNTPSNSGRGMNWPYLSQIASLGRINIIRNAGIYGNTTAQMLARLNADVLVYKPTVMTLWGGTNDIMNATYRDGNGVEQHGTLDANRNDWNMADSQANIIAIVQQAKAAGVQVMLCTIPPIDTDWATVWASILRWNEWLRAYARAESLILWDVFALTSDPLTAPPKWRADWRADGTHANDIGRLSLAIDFMQQMAGAVAGNPEPLTTNVGGYISGVQEPLNYNWIDAGTYSKPYGWLAWDANSNLVRSQRVRQLNAPGWWWEWETNATAGQTSIGLKIPVAPNRRYRFALAFELISAAADANVTLAIEFYNADMGFLGQQALVSDFKTPMSGVPVTEFDLPVGAVNILLRRMHIGAAVSRIGQLTLSLA